MIFEKVKGIDQDAFNNQQYAKLFELQEKKLNDEISKREKKLIDENKIYSLNHCKNSIKHGSKDVRYYNLYNIMFILFRLIER